MKGQTVAVLVCLLLLQDTCSSLEILSFNIRQFGKTKYGKQDVVDVLIKVCKSIFLFQFRNKKLPVFVDNIKL